MALEIFSLVGKVLVDNDEANKSIQKTSDNAEGLGKKLQNGIGTAAKWAAGVTAAATAIGGAMVAAAKDTAAEMDVIDKGAQRMKIATDAYQELSYAAGLSGVSMQTLEKAAKQLEGTDLNMDAALDEIYALGTAEERSAKAAELFGDTVAYQMMPLLNASAEEMAGMRQEAHDLGLVMGEDAVKNGAAMGDMFAKIEASMGALKNSLAAEFMPYVMEILQWVIDEIPRISEVVKKVMDMIMPIIQPILEGVMAFVSGFFKLLDGDFEGFVDGVKTLLVNLGTVLFDVGQDVLNAFWDGIKLVWEKLTGWLGEKIQGIVDKFAGVRDKVLGFFSFGRDADRGSHAAGLNYVPYDGYQATLHRGETVLNAQNTQSMVQDIAGAIKDAIGGAATPSAPIELTLNIDGRQFAQATYDATQREANRRGRSLVGVY